MGRNLAPVFEMYGVGRDARYDYLYSEEEMGGFARTARSMAEEAGQVFVVQNNHFRGQALASGPTLTAAAFGRAFPGGQVLVTLDHTPMGDFVEIEGVGRLTNGVVAED